MSKLTATGPFGVCHLCGKQKTVYHLFVYEVNRKPVPEKKNGSVPMWQLCSECALERGTLGSRSRHQFPPMF